MWVVYVDTKSFAVQDAAASDRCTNAILSLVPLWVQGVGSPLGIIVYGGLRAPVSLTKGAICRTKPQASSTRPSWKRKGPRVLGVSKRDRRTDARRVLKNESCGVRWLANRLVRELRVSR